MEAGGALPGSGDGRRRRRKDKLQRGDGKEKRQGRERIHATTAPMPWRGILDVCSSTLFAKEMFLCGGRVTHLPALAVFKLFSP
jgi:hypothetical protein